ncbi:helicase RepA family protein [Qipengyuania sp. 1NDW9]|uniref:AAA family ATPase n=1 Tax=Qipengyuania xiapuensis TaxID=2867236 RepID=UPI001C87B14F|nr:AAA family ATPase [Qipengyuania xiapuensis]MBX7492653.1 helicase RepA family protein [Qipengyuania xiapuensis]
MPGAAEGRRCDGQKVSLSVHTPSAADVTAKPAQILAEPQADWRSHNVLLLRDIEDTRKSKLGGEYKRITLGEIWERASKPEALAKSKAPAFIPSNFIEWNGRSHDVQRQFGKYHALSVDVDKGNHPKEAILKALAGFLGGAAVLIYSTPSATLQSRRWRVVVPLAGTVDYETWNALQRALTGHLAGLGIVADVVMARAAQISILPTVPPDARDGDGQPQFYEFQRINGHGLDPWSGIAGRAVADVLQQDKRDAEARKLAAEEARRKREKRRAERGDDVSVIDEFNANNDLAGALASCGYKQDPRDPLNWRSPKQTSGSYATRIMDDGETWVSLSGSDAIAGVGQEFGGGQGRYGDAFDLFVHFQHGGDFKAAVRSLHEAREQDERKREEREPVDAASDSEFWSGQDLSDGYSFTPLASLDGSALRPRQWVFGTILQRGEITSIVAPTASGKSTLVAAAAMSMATGKEFLGFALQEGPLRVCVWNLEDDREEIERQLIGAARHFDINMGQINGRLSYQSGLTQSICTVVEERDGLKIAKPVDEALREAIRRDKIDVLVIDPFVKSHAVNENDNRAIDVVVRTWKSLAADLGIAIVLVHHTRKLNDRMASADDSRGASSMSGAVRTVLVIQPMSADVAKELGVPESEREDYIQLVNAKSNRARKGGADWFKKVGVPLGNRDQYGRTDWVAVAEPWTPKDSFAGVSPHDVLRCLERIHDGPDGKGHEYGDERFATYDGDEYEKPLGDRFTASARGGTTTNPRWVGNVIMDEFGVEEAAAKKIIKGWLDTGLLEDRKYYKATTRKLSNGLSADIEKQRGVVAQLEFTERLNRDSGDDV